MNMKLFFSVAISALAVLAPAAHAADWATADTLFAQREGNRDAIAKARAQYRELLGQATAAEDKVRAVEALGRLAIYEGEMLLPKTDTAGRKAIFSDCWCENPVALSRSCGRPGFVDAISPAKLGQETQAYFYFHGVCLGYWGQQVGLVEQLAFVSKLQDDVAKGLAFTPANYEGGGVHRLAAGIYENPQARGVGLYDPDKALVEIDTAIAQPAFQGQEAGNLYFDNFQGKISVLRQLEKKHPQAGWNQKAIDLAAAALTSMQALLDAGTLPQGRSAEFKAQMGLIKVHYKELTGSDWIAH